MCLCFSGYKDFAILFFTLFLCKMINSISLARVPWFCFKYSSWQTVHTLSLVGLTREKAFIGAKLRE